MATSFPDCNLMANWMLRSMMHINNLSLITLTFIVTLEFDNLPQGLKAGWMLNKMCLFLAHQDITQIRYDYDPTFYDDGITSTFWKYTIMRHNASLLLGSQWWNI